MITPESPLRHIPDSVDMRQVAILDGIRYCAQSVFDSYVRLALGLQSRATDGSHEQAAIPSERVFSDAWTIVDSAHRLFGLLRELPRHEDLPSWPLIIEHKGHIKVLRDGTQHIHARLDRLIKKNLPVMGALTWIDASEFPGKGTMSSNLLASGRLLSRDWPAENPAGPRPRAEIDFAKLHAREDVFCVSDYCQALRAIVSELETALAEQFGDAPSTAGSDAHIVAVLQFGDSGEV